MPGELKQYWRTAKKEPLYFKSPKKPVFVYSMLFVGLFLLEVVEIGRDSDVYRDTKLALFLNDCLFLPSFST